MARGPRGGAAGRSGRSGSARGHARDVPAQDAGDASLRHRLASASHRDREPGSPEVLRPGHDDGLRLQPRGGLPFVREGGGARSEGGHAALGHGVRAGVQLQRSRAGRREAPQGASRGRAGPRALGRRPRERARLRRSARDPVSGGSLRGGPGEGRERLRGRDEGALRPLPGRSRRRDVLRREPDEPDALEALDAGGRARVRTRSRSSPCSSRC